jgi:hypothetical protein
MFRSALCAAMVVAVAPEMRAEPVIFDEHLATCSPYQPRLIDEPQQMCDRGVIELTLAEPLDNIVWHVENGTILSGQGTGTVTMRGEITSDSHARVYVSATDPVHGCTFDRVQVASIRLQFGMPPVQITAPASLCPGGVGTATAPPKTNVTYQWSITNGTIIENTGTLVKFTPSASGGEITLGLTLTRTDTLCSFSTQRTVTIGPPTAVVPDETIAMCAGQDAGFSVELRGQPPFNVTWSDGVTINGIYTNSHFRELTATEDIALSITAFSDATCAGTSSGTAFIDVLTPVAIQRQPSSQTIARGQTAVLEIESTGTSFQWFRGTTGDQMDAIPGATAATYTTPPLTQTTSYWAHVFGNCGVESSATATITVREEQTAGGKRRRSVRH